MCGIAGKLHLGSDSRADRREIEAMLEPVKHRGPDGNGIFLDGPAGLGHLRLAIIDVDGGPQPMTNEDDTVWIVFNGEIYNYLELRAGLIARGHKFRNHSDTEVIIHLYEEHGVDCLQHLQGMFTFAIWDKRRRRLFIARDRVGIKPLYYCQTAQTLYFASELKAILADPAISREINPLGVRRFFSFFYPAGDDTLFKSIRKLPPGHFILAENSKVSVQRYWDLQFTTARWNQPYDAVVEELYGLLGPTVRDHLIADVPVGLLLSGGVDSSAVLSFAVQNTTKKIRTYTVGFGGNQVVDERPYARLVAERFGTEHHELSITAEDFWNFLPSYVWHMEEPVHEPPAVALYYISKLAREHVKVLLSGEGGDEAFAGYPNYPNMLKVDRVARALGPLARPAGALAGFAGSLAGSARIHRYGSALGHPLAEHYFSRSSGPTTWFNHDARRIFTPGFLQLTSATSTADFMKELLRPVASAPLLDQMLYADTKTWLPDDLLIKADKMTMANSLELRVPLLDHKVLEFAASLPPEYKVRGPETKRALKSAFAKVLPEEILTRKKAGFPVPYRQWLRHELRDRVESVLLAERAAIYDYVRKDEVKRLLAANAAGQDHGREIFCLLTLELWHRSFLPSP
ncbi:MAG TPA: asparagine synthase (glutamine-hydrolyzing) [Lacunisphaera sp.]|nr:asparagine synthase (glutamine-hydrolyzing) [Lacunisphaera sp.]